MKKLLAVLVPILVSAPALWAGCPFTYGGHGGCSFGYGRGIVFYLLTLALGYWVLRTVENEKTEKRHLRRVGQAVGWIILVVSLFGLLCKGSAALCRRWCPDHAKKFAACHGPAVPKTESPAETPSTPPQTPQ